MKTIHKYELTIIDYQTIMMPVGAKILCAQIQIDRLCIWAQIEDIPTLEEREIHLFGTGAIMPDLVLDYVGTIQMSGGRLVFHVYISSLH